MRRPLAALLLSPALFAIVVILGVPVVYLISFSFFPPPSGTSQAGSFTFANYVRLAGDPFYRGILGKTLVASFLATAIATVVGFCLALFVWRAGKRWRGLLTILVLCPLLVSIVVNSYGWVVVLGNQGVINKALMAMSWIREPLKLIHTDGAIIVGLVHIAIPFMVLSILAALERIESVVPEAAATLGASPPRVVWHVILPLSVPGIAAGTTIVFCLCMSAYVTPAVLGGNGPNFITTLIYNQIVTLLDWPFGAALAALLLVVSLGIVLVYLRLIAAFGARTGEVRGT